MTTATLSSARHAVVGLLLAGAIAACGSTVQAGRFTDESSPGAAGSGEAGLSAPGVAGTSPGSLTTSGVPGSTGRPNGASASTPLGIGTGAAPSGASLAPRVASGGPVQVGVVYIDSAGAQSAGQALGYSVNPGDPYAEAQALVAWLNHHGGLAGHPVQPLYEKYPVGGNPDTFEQSACQDWTQDHHAVAVIYPTNFSANGVLTACLARAHVLLTGGADTYLNSSQLSAANGYLVTPYMFAGNRMSQLLVDQLVAQNWFGPGSKIGLISVDGPAYAADAKVIAQRLAAHGLTVSDQATIADASPQQDSQNCQSVALRFAADHITNVVVNDEGAVVMLYCTPVFRTQNYYPRLSISSYDSPSTVQSIVPADSLRGSAGIGWEPVNDVPNPTANSSARLCLQVMKDAGQNVTSSAIAEAIAMAYCDGFFFLHQAYAEAGSVAPVEVQGAIARLGAGYTSPIALSVRFAPGRYDGVSAAARLVYQTSCRCYQYQGRPASAP